MLRIETDTVKLEIVEGAWSYYEDKTAGESVFIDHAEGVQPTTEEVVIMNRVNAQVNQVLLNNPIPEVA